MWILVSSVVQVKNQHKIILYITLQSSQVNIFISAYDRYWDTQYRNIFMNYFLFEVGVEISDHPLTADLSTFPLSIVLQVGNIFMQGTVCMMLLNQLQGNLLS